MQPVPHIGTAIVRKGAGASFYSWKRHRDLPSLTTDDLGRGGQPLGGDNFTFQFSTAQ